MTARDLMERMERLVSIGYGDLEVRCMAPVEWAWPVIEDGKASHVILSVKHDAEVVKEEQN